MLKANQIKVYFLLFVLMIFAGLTACSDTENGEDEHTSSQTERAKPATDTVNIIGINGKSVSLPFSVSELGSEYSVSSGEAPLYLQHNGINIAFVELDNEENIISLTYDESFQTEISIGDFTSKNTLDEIRAALGEPYSSSENTITYRFEGCSVTFAYPSDDYGYEIAQIRCEG